MIVNTWNTDGRFKVHIPHLDTTVTIVDGDDGPIVSVSVPTPPRLTDEILNEARVAFWRVIGERFPDVGTGDLPFDTTDHFDITARGAIDRWLELNAAKPTAVWLNDERMA
jgi:hypothetical protein